MTWIYWRSETNLWTVGHYNHKGGREPESDHDDREGAARRVHYLNGGNEGAIRDLAADLRHAMRREHGE